MSKELQGVLVVDKPQGPTSFDVVRRVRSLLRVKKAGHTGTLDPLATGVLPICLGDATRIQSFITEGDKAYQAVLQLGAETDTLDAEGKVVSEGPVPALTRDSLEQVLAPLRGPQLQTPPMFSAVKVDGKRLYEHARAGETVERAARPVTVYSLELLDFSASELRLEVRCSKGFFVRVLAQDIGRALGCGAHLRALRRTHSGPFSLKQALTLDALEALIQDKSPEALTQLQARLVTADQALTELPSLTVSAEDADRVLHGVPLEARAAKGKVRVHGPDGRLLAVAEANPPQRLKYLRVLS